MIELEPVTLDLNGWMSNLRREGTPTRVFYYAHGVDEAIQQQLDERESISKELDRASEFYPHQRRMLIHRFLGQELFRIFPDGARILPPTRDGEWVEEGTGAVTDRKSFEKFDWPDPNNMDTSPLEYFERNLPEDMRVVVILTQWEVVRDLMGFETFCYQLVDDREFIEDMLRQVGEFNLAVARTLCDFDCLGAVYLSDDLGFKTSTMIAADDIRELIIPWHKRLAELVHEHNKLLLFHSCGQMYDLMDDYIDNVKIDAKHSFEDVIKPVTGIKKEYGDRLTLLGGMDVDLLARADEKAIRTKTREILDVCFPGGGYFMGSGNWVTKYIPLDNYLMMLDEARRYTK